MRLVYMGTPDFAVPALRHLAASHEILAVYTRPDSVSGRGASLLPSPVKSAALELGLEVFCPANLRSPETIDEITSLSPDFIIVAAYGCILPKAVLDVPTFGCLNIHASLLPRWRGAAPIQRAILAADDLAGVSIMRMEEGLDTGDFCHCASIPVAAHNTESLSAALAELGAKLILKAIDDIVDGTVQWQSQDDGCSCYAAKIDKSELLLDPNASARENLCRVRASSAAAPARACICGRSVTVLELGPSDQQLSSGQVLFEQKKVIIGCSDASLELIQLKPDGKKAMPVQAWRSGLKDVPMDWGRL